MRTPFGQPDAPPNRRRAPLVAASEPEPRPTKGGSFRERVKRRARAFYERARGPAFVLGRVLLTVIAVASTVALYRVVDRWVRTAPEFALTEIAVEGQDRLSSSELRAVADVHLGDNVFSTSPEEVRAALRAHPWIADAEVVRRLPGTLRITVREHQAVAILMLDEPYLIASDATVIKRLEPSDPSDLPVITGVDRVRFVGDLGFRTQLLATMVALIAEYQSSGLADRVAIAELHLEPTDELTLFVGDDPVEVRLGRGPYRPKLERFARVLDELRREEASAAYVLLDNVRRPDRVTVRLR